MNREIKFRGKRIDNGEWVIGSYIQKWYDGVRISPVIIVDESENVGLIDDKLVKYYIIPESIGQFTGLKDKNGKEIYEGDIVEVVYNHEIGEKTIWQYMIEDIRRLPRLWGSNIDSIKVIGNIYENPELLEVR